MFSEEGQLIVYHGEGLTDKAGSKRQAGRQARLARQGKARQGKAGGKAGQAVDNQNSVRSRGLLGPIMGDASGVSIAPISAYPRRNEIRPDWQYTKTELSRVTKLAR